MTHGSLFSGIGGFDLAAQWIGWENVFHCEINDYAKKILTYYWPKAINYNDIKKTDFSIHEYEIDALTGGFPCQGFSTAGKRLGTNDDRYLWPEMLRVIKQIKPSFIIGENVAGIKSMEDKSGVWSEVFPRVEGRKIVRYDTIDLYEAIFTRQAKMLITSICEDLEQEGYEVQPIIIPAASIGAPHRRDRTWFIAYSKSNHDRRNARAVRQKDEFETKERQEEWLSKSSSSSQGNAFTNANSNDTIGHRHGQVGCEEEESKTVGQKRQRVRRVTPRVDEKRTSSNTAGIGSQGQGRPKFSFGTTQDGDWKASWSYDDGRWPTQPPIRTGDDGLSTGLVRSALQGAGNAIVPQVALEIFKAINRL